MANRIINPAVPNLPLGTEQYERRYQDQFTNILRLYFNQLKNALGELFGVNGGNYLSFPHIAASDSNTQYATAANTPTIVQWTSLDAGSGFTLNANNTATAQISGIYKITYSLQFANNDNAIHDAIVWLRVNGADVSASSTIFTVPARKSAGIFNYVCGYSHVTFQVDVGDVISLVWATQQGATANASVAGIFIDALPASTSPYPRPSIPSAIGTIQFVSAIPS